MTALADDQRSAARYAGKLSSIPHGPQDRRGHLMPIPDAVARFNRIATNRVTGPFAGHLPGFALVHHTGRRSGRAYKTPVGIVQRHDRYTIALTYGPDCDWVKNVIAAGGCELELRGTTVHVGDPQIVHDTDRSAMPPGVRQILKLISVADFLHLTKA